MKSCDVKKLNAQALKNYDDLQDEMFFRDCTLSNEDTQFIKRTSNFFLKALTGKKIITSKTLQRKINQDYKGREAERNFVLLELTAILDKNPGIRDMINEKAVLAMLTTDRKNFLKEGLENKKSEVAKLPQHKKSYNKKEISTIKKFATDKNISFKSYDPPQIILEKIQRQYAGVNYSDLSIGSLRRLLGNAQDIVKNGKGEDISKGVIGKLRVEMLTTKGLARYDSTGAINIMSEGVTNYTSNITRHINRFAEKNTFGDTKINRRAAERTYGMDDVFRQFQDTASRLMPRELKEAMKFNNEFATDFFMRYLTGWVKLKDGKFTIASTYAPVVIDGKVQKYESTGDTIYAYQNYVSFDEYLKKRNSLKGLTRDELKKSDRYHRSFNVDENYVKMVKIFEENYSLIQKYYDFGQGIHKEVFDYTQKNFAKATNELMIELKQYFPNLDISQIKELLTTSDVESVDAFNLLTEEEQDSLLYVLDAFGSYNLLDPYIFGAQDFQEKKDSFPILYNQTYFKTVMWEEALNEARAANSEATNQLIAARNLYETDKNNKEDKQLYNDAIVRRKQTNSEVLRMELIRDRLDDYPEDHMGNTMAIARDVSVLKTITNSFDVRNQRADVGVYGDYLNKLFSGLERNRLSIKLLKALRIAKSDAAKDAIVSQYKGINNDPTARSSFLGIPTDLNSIETFLNKIPLVNVSADIISRKVRAFNSWTTGLHLRGVGSAALNLTAIQEGFFAFGVDKMYKALKRMSSEKKAIDNIVKISGIVDFSDFIQQGIVQKAVDWDLTVEQADEVVRATLKYWKDISNGKNKNKALRELRKYLIVAVDSVPSEFRTDIRRKKLKSDRRKRMVNVFANWAIEKQYDVKQTMTRMPYKFLKPLQVPIDSAVKFGQRKVSLWGEALRKFGATMGQTEQLLRTWQFVAGITEAQESGLIPNVPLEELEGQDLEAAINIGRQYVQVSAFSVGRENIGEISRGEVGGFLTKFKYYAIQKFGSDVDKFKQAFFEMQTYADGEKQSDIKTIAKLLEKVVRFRKTPMSVLRTTHPAVATLRSFLAIQGILTPMVDLFIFGPFAMARHVPGVRKVAYMSPGMKTIGGMTSDLISLTLMAPTIMIALSMGDWGDEEGDILDAFEYYMRRTPAGYGAVWVYDTFMALMSMLMGADTEDKVKDIKNALSPVIPREISRNPFVPIDETLESIVEN